MSATVAAPAVTGRYFGSLTAEHGDVVSIHDCDCWDCVQFDLWDDARRFELRVRRDSDSAVVTLEHVRNASFTGTRQG